jgi:hypothetical protein
VTIPAAIVSAPMKVKSRNRSDQIPQKMRPTRTRSVAALDLLMVSFTRAFNPFTVRELSIPGLPVFLLSGILKC